jgi:hypothetical protein
MYASTADFNKSDFESKMKTKHQDFTIDYNQKESLHQVQSVR